MNLNRFWKVSLGSLALALGLAPLVAWATAAYPENVSGDALLIGLAKTFLDAFRTHNYGALLGPGLLLVGILAKDKRAGSILSWVASKLLRREVIWRAPYEAISPRWRALALLVFGAASIGGTAIMAGVPFWSAIWNAINASLSATGLYEIWQGARGTPTAAETRVRELEGKLVAVKAAAGRKDWAEVARLGNEI